MKLMIQGREVLVDDVDAGLITGYAWFISNTSRKNSNGASEYVRCTINGYDTLMMHRLIMDAKPGELIDHVDGNGLNNQRCNLRKATAGQQQYNKRVQKKRAAIHSKYKGVSYIWKSGKWKAQIHKDYKSISLGTFDTEEEAAQAYDRAAKELFGEYARTNF